MFNRLTATLNRNESPKGPDSGSTPERPISRRAVRPDAESVTPADAFDPCLGDLRYRVRQALLACDSAFGRLVMLAALRTSGVEAASGGISTELSPLIVERELAPLHVSALVEWLSLNRAAQSDDLIAYFAAVPDGRRLVPELLEIGRRALPPETRSVEAELFIQDLLAVQSRLAMETID